MSYLLVTHSMVGHSLEVLWYPPWEGEGEAGEAWKGHGGAHAVGPQQGSWVAFACWSGCWSQVWGGGQPLGPALSSLGGMTMGMRCAGGTLAVPVPGWLLQEKLWQEKLCQAQVSWELLWKWAGNSLLLGLLLHPSLATEDI